MGEPSDWSRGSGSPAYRDQQSACEEDLQEVFNSGSARIKAGRRAMGQFTPRAPSEFGFTETAPLIKGILALWFALLAPWLPFAVFGGMAFDGGDTLAARTFVLAIWTYPVSLFAAFTFRQKMPLLVLLPCLNLAVLCISGS